MTNVNGKIMTESLTKDSVIFLGKSLSDVFADIYTNSKSKQKNIDAILDSVKNLMTNITDTSILMPILKEVLEISVKNDDQLVKLATIIQRLLDKPVGFMGTNPMQPFITEEEKRQIVGNTPDLIAANNDEINESLKQLEEKVKLAKEKINSNDKQLIQNVSKNNDTSK